MAADSQTAIVMIRLSAAPRAFFIFDTGSSGFAALHPRLYAIAPLRGLKQFQLMMNLIIGS